jgi:uncharacterized protein involved in exopolysaccharide biosynthesis
MNSQEPEFSIIDWMRGKAAEVIEMIMKQYKLLILAAVLGAALGLGYNWIKSTRYTAEITFIVEDNKNMGGGILSALGGQLGFDISSLSGGGNGLLSGDNVLELLKSRSMMAECLKTPYGNDTSITLADRYAEVYKLRKQWADSKEVGREIIFGKVDQNSRLQDSLLKVIVKRIVEKQLSIYKPDKKLGFFRVTVSTKDELLSKLIAERIIKIATDFYIDARTGRLKKNIDRLQGRTDSLEAILNKRTYSATAENRLMLNANPAFIDQPVTREISEREKIMMGTIYAELMKNLEISKTALIQETPAVQIVDHASLPLENDRKKWYINMLWGLLAGFTIMLLGILLKSGK